jgi:hypothetical protein
MRTKLVVISFHPKVSINANAYALISEKPIAGGITKPLNGGIIASVKCASNTGTTNVMIGFSLNILGEMLSKTKRNCRIKMAIIRLPIKCSWLVWIKFAVTNPNGVEIDDEKPITLFSR